MSKKHDDPPVPNLSELLRSESAPLLSGERRENRDLNYGTTSSETSVARDGILGDGENVGSGGSRSFPLGQILILGFLRMASPIANAQIYPVSTDNFAELRCVTRY